MFRVIRATILLVMAFVGVLYAVRLIGGVQPDPLALWFANPDGSACSQPCLFGITPGVTMYKDAVQMLSHHPVTRDMKRGRLNDVDPENAIGLGDNYFCLLIENGNGGRVGLISVSSQVCYFAPTVPNGNLTLGQFVAALGNPDAAVLGNYGVAPDKYFFDGGQLVFQAWNINSLCSVSPTMTYQLITLLDYDTRAGDEINWQGFASRKHYSFSPDALASLGDCHP